MVKVNGFKMKVLLLGITVCVLSCSSIVKADFIFGEPTIVSNLSGPNSDGSPQISRDGLELYLNYNVVGGECNTDIWVSKRSTTDDAWSIPTKLEPPVNSPGPERTPSLSADGLELYFSDGYPSITGCHVRTGGYGHTDLWVSTRASKDDPWSEPENLGPLVNSENAEDTPCISADGLELYFMSDSPGGGTNPSNTDIFVTSRPTKDDPWGEPVKLYSNVNSDRYEYAPFISPDGLLLFFSRGFSKAHVWVSKRASTNDPWGPAQFFTPVNSGKENDIWTARPGNTEFCVSFCEADSTLYFARGSDVFATDYDIWQVEVTPIVDLNGDGIVDALDITIMVDNWHTDNSICDIAPAPLGDGFVDIQDLTVLAEHLFEEIPAP